MANHEKDETAIDPFDKLFEDVKNTNPVEILVISLDENMNMNFNTNMGDYRSLVYLLSRANFEVILHEKGSRTSSQEDDGKAA